MDTILFFGKKNDPYVTQALNFCLNICKDKFEVIPFLNDYGEKIPYSLLWVKSDILVSFRSRWVVPKPMLDNSRLPLNFHPAPPEYAGIGCTNFALYDGAKKYGVTCHHMTQCVDEGEIVKVVRFPIYENDTVESLLNRTYAYQLVLFYDIIGRVVKGIDLPKTNDMWGKCTTRKDLNELATITPDMSKDEISKRIRATTYGKWKPTIIVNGFMFEVKNEDNARQRVT